MITVHLRLFGYFCIINHLLFSSTLTAATLKEWQFCFTLWYLVFLSQKNNDERKIGRREKPDRFVYIPPGLITTALCVVQTLLRANTCREKREREKLRDGKERDTFPRNRIRSTERRQVLSHSTSTWLNGWLADWLTGWLAVGKWLKSKISSSWSFHDILWMKKEI